MEKILLVYRPPETLSHLPHPSPHLPLLFGFLQHFSPSMLQYVLLLPSPSLTLGAVRVSSQSNRSAFSETTAATGESHQHADTRWHGMTHTDTQTLCALSGVKERQDVAE